MLSVSFGLFQLHDNAYMPSKLRADQQNRLFSVRYRAEMAFPVDNK